MNGLRKYGTYFNGILLSHKKELNNVATWMDLEIIIVSEVSQRKTNII